MHWILGELHAGDVVDQLANNLLLPLDFPPRRWYSFLCYFYLIVLVHNDALDQPSLVGRPPIRDLLMQELLFHHGNPYRGMAVAVGFFCARVEHDLAD
ncbi:hypothetical protein RSOL_301490 [Rhizoctonia solani AG-3 Rhs1AP]|uniref:Uncharacterized protein n=1 Tax=Rhizoctonia solani AG-3 Rhs1AP TaxID=1086054 RepID=A0A0A1UJI2_9AGAM|nr:hypothetical protein RSOL_301490 [Rhizoctonia solani AG-3 Rhs1AP]